MSIYNWHNFYILPCTAGTAASLSFIPTICHANRLFSHRLGTKLWGNLLMGFHNKHPFLHYFLALSASFLSMPSYSPPRGKAAIIARYLNFTNTVAYGLKSKIKPVACYFTMFITVTLQPIPQFPYIKISHSDCFISYFPSSFPSPFFFPRSHL